MKLYTSDTTNFNNNGVGVIDPYVTSAIVTDEINGEYSLTFDINPYSPLSEYIVQDNYVKCKVSDGTEQIFIIKKITKTFDAIGVYCQHVFYELLDNLVLDIYPQNATPNQFITRILSNTNYVTPFSGFSDIITTKTARYVRKNPIEIMIGEDENSMINLFGGELKRDNFTINYLSHIGSNNGEVLRLGKNITGITIDIDTSNIATRILPLGYDGIMVESIYVDSQYISNYPRPIIKVYKFENIKFDPEDDNAYHTLEEAQQALTDAVNSLYAAGLDLPTINVAINWVELSKTKEYENYQSLERIRLGDTLTCNILNMNYTTEIIKTTYNVLTDTIDGFEMGAVKSNIVSTLNNLQRQENAIQVDSILESAKESATRQITSAMGGYVYKTQNELYIMDTDDPSTATKVWRWNLNGLGYSSTGINGPYGLAMTQDGQIVADYITTGTMSAERIYGLNDILTGNNQWFSFSDNGLTIHQGENAIQLVLDEDSIEFQDANGNLIAAWSAESNTTTSTTLKLGNYKFEPRTNGSLDFKHI